MSVRCCEPASRSPSTSAYAASRAAARSGPVAVPQRTRPAGGDQRAVAGPARGARVDAPRPSAPVITSPVRGAPDSRRGDHHRHRRTRPASAAAGARRASPVAAACSRPASGVSSSASTTCVSGSPKRALNSITFGPAGGERQPDVEQAGERRAPAAHLGQRRLDHRRPSRRRPGRRRPRQRRVRTHAAGVRAGVAVADPLEVLGRQQRYAPPSPSVTTNSETSGPSRYSSMTTRPQSAACASAAARSSVTTTPLPAASPSFFTTYGGPNSSSARAASSRVGADARAGGRHPGGGHDLLGERLGALQLGRRARRAEAGDALGPDGVGDPGDERRLRPDHDQVGADLDGERGDRLRIGRLDGAQLGDRARCRDCPAPRSARSTAGSSARPERERMLPPAGADQKYAHDRRSYRSPSPLLRRS